MRSENKKRRHSSLLVRSCVEPLENRTLLSGYTLAKLGYFTDGGNPVGGVIADSAGDLFGLTQAGGINKTGSVYEVSAAGSPKPVTVASFPASTTGSLYPNSLVLDSSGNLFGTADRGGANGTGFIFEVAKDGKTITTLASFDADGTTNSTGAYPEGNIQIDSAGDLFGTTTDGGQIINATGGGTYWELKTSSSTITPLAVFPTLNSTSSGTQYPARSNSFTKDSAGDVFGIAEGNQQQGYYGYVWEIPANTSTVNTLATFNNTNGADPSGRIAIDTSGDIFGTTIYGGTGQVTNSSGGAGVVWEVRANSGSITDLASFSTSVGYSPDGLALDSKGDLFGTANYGGTAIPADGTVWELPNGSSTITSLAAFGASGGGQSPDGGVLIDSQGDLFGATFEAGGPQATGNGSVFELTAPGKTIPAGTAALSPVVTKTTLASSIVAGSTTRGTANVKVTNNGTGAASGNAIISVYASTDGVIDSGSTLLGQVTHALNTKAGKTTPITVTIKSVPSTLNGNYTLLAQSADAQGNTVNATTGLSLKIAPAFISFADTVTKINLPPSSISGQVTKAVAQIKITNNGNIISQGTTTIALYASPDGTVANGLLIRNFITSVVLKPKASKTVPVPLLTIPASANGNYFLVAKVTDPLSNNTTAASTSKFSLAAPFVSLVPTIVSNTLPATSASGSVSNAVLTLSIINNGNISPTTAATVSVYASTSGTVSGGTLLSGSPFTTPLKPAKSAKIKVGLGNFPLLAPGHYFLVVQVTQLLSPAAAVVSATTYTVT